MEIIRDLEPRAWLQENLQYAIIEKFSYDKLEIVEFRKIDPKVMWNQERM